MDANAEDVSQPLLNAELVAAQEPSSPQSQSASPPRVDRASNPQNSLASASAMAALVRAQRQTYDDGTPAHYAEERALRQEMRRLVDPGIMRNNGASDAQNCIELLLKLCENILDNPEEEKYRQFKTTNKTIQAKLMEPKGGVEMAVAMGFRARVENFQPMYHFSPTEKNLRTLRVGVDVLREFEARAVIVEERTRKAREGEKLAAARAKEKVMKAYEDDRKSVAIRQSIERQQRLARGQAAEVPSDPSEQRLPSPRLTSPKPNIQTFHQAGGDAEDN